LALLTKYVPKRQYILQQKHQKAFYQPKTNVLSGKHL
jgi:hypothetical protein